MPEPYVSLFICANESAFLMHYRNGVFVRNKELIEDYWAAHFDRDWVKMATFSIVRITQMLG